MRVGSETYLSVSGTESPRSAEFRKKLGALYGCAYTVKLDGKIRHGRDFKVGALEAPDPGPGIRRAGPVECILRHGCRLTR